MSIKELAATLHKAVFKYEKGEEHILWLKKSLDLKWGGGEGGRKIFKFIYIDGIARIL